MPVTKFFAGALRPYWDGPTIWRAAINFFQNLSENWDLVAPHR